MIIPEDINKQVKDLFSKYKLENKYFTNETIRDSPLIKEEILKSILENHELNDDNLGISSIYLIQEIISNCLHNIVEEYNKRKLYKVDIFKRLEKLKQLELPEQRSKEWYEIREKIITASSLADCLGKGHFKSKEDLLIEKTSKDPPARFTNDIIEHGVKYEPIATTFYEKLNKLKVVEFGLVPHEKFKIFGASPDGICDIDSPEDYIGRMLEIKCPPVRKFTKEVPEHYWMQMQGQLETCDLEECDFLQVKIIEYENEQEYLNDTSDDNKDGISSNNLPKGLVLTFIKIIDNKKQYHYEYCEFYKSFDEIKEWATKIIDNYNFDENEKVIYNWWKIERYECTLVYRDREWWLDTMPKILDFWEDVEHYRKIGNQELIDKKNEKKNKRKSKSKKTNKTDKNIIIINQEINNAIKDDYLLEDSDSDTE